MTAALRPLRKLSAGAFGLACLTSAAHADIYTCVDAKGRRLTADRPIIECNDREQSQVTPTGTVVRKIGPSLTADERAALEEKQKQEAEERNRQLEEKRRDRSLLARYPDRAAHDKERAASLATADDVMAAARKRLDELTAERKKMDVELEFYKGDASKAPPKVKRQFDEINTQIAGQKRFIANQELEKQRINARYDEELARLTPLWNARMIPAASSAKRTAG